MDNIQTNGQAVNSAFESVAALVDAIRTKLNKTDSYGRSKDTVHEDS